MADAAATATGQDLALTAEERAASWDDWVRRGPQGPMEDDEQPEFPRSSTGACKS